ncbi:MAG TPA: STN domain-containing protein [Vicinamibacteria bacterium]|nr:STN domain-containing protein [Vicinamibacteria bacterium]
MKRDIGALSVLLILLAGSCASRSPLELGHRSAREGNWDAAVDFYRKALEAEPEDLEARSSLLRASLEASRIHLRRARDRREVSDLSGAATELEIALQYDPTNRYAREELEEIRAAIEAGPPEAARPRLQPEPDTLIDLRISEPTGLREIVEQLARMRGVNVIFDEAYRDREIVVELRGVTFEQALDLLLHTHGLFYKVVDSKTVRLVED